MLSSKASSSSRFFRSFSSLKPPPSPPNLLFPRSPLKRRKFRSSASVTLIEHFSVISTKVQSIAVASASRARNGIARFSTMSYGGDNVVQFQLSPSSALKILKGDITKWSVDGSSDAIVNPANELMLGGGGADGAIHRAAGPALRAACYEVPEVRPGVRCPTGEARITPGFNLPASRVIHTVGPIYYSDPDPKGSLQNSYRNSLRVAVENNIQYVAFPAISCGVFRYPFEGAATIAISTMKEFGSGLKEVHFILFSDELYDIWVKKATELLQK